MARTEKRRIGDIGESAACLFLEKHGFMIIERNYLRKWGELDIIAKKGSVVRFIEVKSQSGTHVTGYRPEENVHSQKLRRLSRAIQTYILERKLDGCDWQFDIITVKIDEAAGKAHVEHLEDIVIS